MLDSRRVVSFAGFPVPLAINASVKGIAEIHFARHEEEHFAAPECGDDAAERHLQQCVVELEEYFAGKRRKFSIPLDARGSAFQKKVWDRLSAIPYGETRSYSDIAHEVGQPKAARAVGMANNKNPIAIVVPCHRVIGSNGNLTGYAGGLEQKKILLNLESGFGGGH